MNNPQEQDEVQDEMTLQWKARVVFYYFCVVLISTIHVIPLILLSAAGAKYKTRYYIARSYAWSFMALLRWICNIDFKIERLEKLPKGPAVLLSNHQSFWDNVITPHIFPIQSWVVKKQLYNIPLFGLGLRLVEPIAVDRSENMSVKQILNMGAEKLAAGLWVILFPESTRVPVGRRVKLKPSGVKLAQNSNVPIVPMVHNAGVFWPKGFWIKKPGTIQIKIGPILYPKPEDDVRQITQEIETWMHHEKDKLSGSIGDA